jgi:hypothetical protein
MSFQCIHYVTLSRALVRVADNRTPRSGACAKVSDLFPGESRNRGRARKCWSLLACLLASLLCATPALATVCVSTPSELDAALTAASSNGIDDEIRVVVGSYLLTAELVYFAAPTETGKLTLIGGWAPNCLAQAIIGETTLDGQDMVRPLSVVARGSTTIRRLNFVHGKPVDYGGAGLTIYSVNGADLTIEANAFVNNEQLTLTEGGVAGGVWTSTAGTMVLRNNLFFFNTAYASAINIDGPDGGMPAGDIYITGNTFVANQQTSIEALGVVVLDNPSHVWISNNLFWNNAGNDVFDWGPVSHTDYRNNDIGLIGGISPLSMIGNLNVDPLFDGFLSTRLKPSSLLVNAGLDAAPGGLGFVDESGAARRVGLHVDIGAFETDVLLRTGFEP